MTRPGGNGSAGRVLVVEDDEGIREMLKYNLVTAGFSVHEAADGASGLRTARTARPDLILLDLMLPGMSGFDFCRALRAVTLLLVAHNLERISDRVTNVAEDIVFLETGQVVELG